MKISKPKIILDTNVLLVSLAPQSPYFLIFEALIEEKFELVIHNEIISEYEEVISKRYNSAIVNDVLEMVLHLDNTIRQDIYFKWNLIQKDPDDNKFVDIYLASGADYLVTNDRHFDILKDLGFPKINLVKAEEFLEMLQSS
jgi:putative PIN family toxin of toxin-antitoxin system